MTGLESMDVAAAAQLACLLEASAPKPGNVSPGIDFTDTSYEDFMASAAAIGLPLGGAGSRPVGETIWLCIEATRRWTTSNTNLGIVLLFAPLAKAATVEAVIARRGAKRRSPLPRGAPATKGGIAIMPTEGPTFRDDGSSSILRASLAHVLAETTVDDARETYAAIRLASPGGLGTAPSQDVAREPTVTLTEVMRLAASRDGIAREYTTNFQTTFETAAPALRAARRDGLTWNDAIVETFLTVLASSPDTHIARRGGAELAAEVSRQAEDALRTGGVRSDTGRNAILKMHTTLRHERNRTNPGTTADITAAAIFIALLGGAWHRKTGGLDAASR